MSSFNLSERRDDFVWAVAQIDMIETLQNGDLVLGIPKSVLESWKHLFVEVIKHAENKTDEARS